MLQKLKLFGRNKKKKNETDKNSIRVYRVDSPRPALHPDPSAPNNVLFASGRFVPLRGGKSTRSMSFLMLQSFGSTYA